MYYRVALGYMVEEVVTLVVNEYECGEILNFDFPDSLHAEFRIFETFNALDRVLGKDSSGAAYRSEIESAMFMASIRYLLATVTFGYHHH